MDEKDLKIMALKEQFSEAVSQYQDRIADLRVANTVLTQQLNEARENQAETTVEWDDDGTPEGELLAADV